MEAPAPAASQDGGVPSASSSPAGHEGSAPQMERRIAVLAPSEAAGGDALVQAAKLLVDDLADAYAAYERMSSYQGDEAERTLFTKADGTPCRVAIAPCASNAMPDAGAVAAALGASPHDAPGYDGAHVYLVVVSSSEDGTEALSKLGELSNSLRAYGIVHAGSVIVTHGDQIPALMRTPRLGMWRRPVAESIDSLIAAMRMGSTLGAPIIASPSRLWLRLRDLRCSKDRS